MNKRCGYIGIIGRPNVGKSTLLNRLLGVKLSISSRKPQTTREQILGILTTENAQYVFIDTPGMHQSVQKYSNRLMNRAANTVLEEVGILVWVVDASHLNPDDEAILKKLSAQDKPLIVVLNKQDQVDQEELFILAKRLAAELPKAEFIPCSARTGFNMDILLENLYKKLPEQEFMYAPDLVTDRSEKFYAAEIIREKIMRHTGEELPYACTVEIEKYEMVKNVLHIDATIWVDKENHKPIVIGRNGEHLKKIGQEARLDLEAFWDQKVFLKLWVKVKKRGFVAPVY